MRVATARHQAEAEMLQGLLLEAGMPSLVRRSGGFDVPDFLAAGPRDVLVPRGGEAAAREALGDATPSRRRRSPAGDAARRRGCARWPSRSRCWSSRVVAAGVFAAVFS